MTRATVITFVGLTLVACSGRQAEERVKELLIDPSSAEFSDVHSGKGVTCGFVNAKNRLGGFTGPRLFIVRGNTAQVADDVLDPGLVNDLKDCDSRVFERVYRTTLHDKIVDAKRKVRSEDAAHH